MNMMILKKIKPYSLFIVLGGYIGFLLLFKSPDLPLSLSVGSASLTGQVVQESSSPQNPFVIKTAQNQLWLIKPPKTLQSPLRYGDSVSITGIQMWPFVSNPGQFDYGLYLSRKHIRGILKAQHIHRVGHRVENPFVYYGLYWHHQIVSLNRALLPKPYGDMLTSFVFGDNGLTLPEDIQTHFQKTGLTHLLVVSGAQVAFLSGLALIILQAFSLSSRMIFVVSSLISVIFYFITGGGSSILRAVIMSEVALGLSLLNRRTSIYHILAFTLGVMLIIDPMALWDIGAQLSFLATVSLIAGAPQLELLFPHRWPVFFKKLLSVSLAPLIFSTPLMWAYFQTLSPIAFISNALVLTWAEFVVGLGFLSTVLGLIHPFLALIPVHFCWVLMGCLNAVTEYLAAIPFATFSLSVPSGWEIGVVYMLIIGFFFVPKKYPQRFPFLCAGCILFFFWILISRYWIPGPLKVTYIDVGQGDSILIETPSHKTILIDAGDLIKDYKTHAIVFDTGKRVIEPLLKYKGINTIDLAVVTHFHKDHIGGILYLVEHFPIKAVLDNGIADPGFPAYFKSIRERHITHLKAVGPSVLTLDHGITLQLLFPWRDAGSEKNKNNTSVTFKLTYQNVSFLFTGDLEEEKEEELVSKYGNKLHATVLKLGHHGSKTSSTMPFLQAVHPQVAIISAGRNNHFGHPNQETLDKLQHLHIRTLRTDLDGAIEWHTDGQRLSYKIYMQHGLAK